MPTQKQVTSHALAWIAVANAFKSAYVLGSQMSAYNRVNDPGWAIITHETNPELVNEQGLVIGTEVTPTEIRDAILSVEIVLADMSGKPHSQPIIDDFNPLDRDAPGPRKVNPTATETLEKLTKPIV